MTGRPDLFLLTIAYEVTGVHGDHRDGWEPFLEDARWLIAVTQPDTFDERS